MRTLSPGSGVTVESPWGRRTLLGGGQAQHVQRAGRSLHAGEHSADPGFGSAGVARGAGGDWAEGVRAALKGALLSPWFLYRVELHPVDDASRLTGFELATRLSFALWASLPDDRLLDLAAAGSRGLADGGPVTDLSVLPLGREDVAQASVLIVKE